MRLKRQITAVAILLVLLLTVACDKQAYRRAAQASDDIAIALKGLQQTNADLFYAEKLSVDETRAVAVAVKNATLADDQFIAKLKTLGNSAADPANKPTVVQWIGELADSIERLNQDTALYVKNQEARDKITLTIKALQASITIIQTSIGGAQ